MNDVLSWLLVLVATFNMLGAVLIIGKATDSDDVVVRAIAVMLLSIFIMLFVGL